MMPDLARDRLARVRRVAGLEEMKREETPQAYATFSEGFIAQIEQMRHGLINTSAFRRQRVASRKL